MSDEFSYNGIFSGNASASGIDDYFQQRKLDGDYYRSVKDLVYKQALAGTEKDSTSVVQSGTRVSFVGDLESLMTYDDAPDPGAEGSVVMVRTSNGDRTYDSEGWVNVRWDDGTFRRILARHLRVADKKKMAKTGDPCRIVTSSLGDLSDYFVPANSRESDLIHKSTRDLWSFRQEGGQYVIERLFDETGEPLKEN